MLGRTHDTLPALLPADRDGRLVGGDAVQFFERSGLPRDVLAKVGAAGAEPRSSWEHPLQGSNTLRVKASESHHAARCLSTSPPTAAAQVWAAADNKRQGFLDFNAFVKALELMSLAQVAGQIASCLQCCSVAVGSAGRRSQGLVLAADGGRSWAVTLPRLRLAGWLRSCCISQHAAGRWDVSLSCCYVAPRH